MLEGVENHSLDLLGKSQEQRGKESLSEFVSTQLNKGVLFHYQKS
jgi:hypothetical protein